MGKTRSMIVSREQPGKSWGELLQDQLRLHGEQMADVQVCTHPRELYVRFDEGGARRTSWVAWTDRRVYFPVVQDVSWIVQAEMSSDELDIPIRLMVMSAPRNPQPGA